MSKQSTQQYCVKQCWISDAELNLGIGVVQNVAQHQLTLFFSACDEQRVYSRHSAPLTRLLFSIGDKIKNPQGDEIVISDITELNDCYIYFYQDKNNENLEFHESQIYPIIELNRPAERLFNLQIDSNQSFNSRYLSRHYLKSILEQDIIALTGSRTSLIPHQLYVTNQVAKRHDPRVLLADEVGLGKTIEAGMILSYQLFTEKVNRVLIIVPESLVHQWLVEMLRRFNLHFSIFDEERCLAEAESSGLENPFFTEQLILCHLSFIEDNPHRLEQLYLAKFDMMIVDEAHHLQWDVDTGGSGIYQSIELLSKVIPSVLLLTATPEQLGKESHFARLRLLDSERFYDYSEFLKQESSYQNVAEVVKKLLQSEQMTNKDKLYIESITTDEITKDDLQKINELTTEQSLTLRQNLTNQLLDSHGTGRILFRNTRSAISGFPERIERAYGLELPQPYQHCIDTINQSSFTDLQAMLSLESLYALGGDSTHWTEFDSRLPWLQAFLQQNSQYKVLIICAYADTAKEIQHFLQHRHGIRCSVFDEHLSLIERDRAAAYFSEEQSGCQALICSEIGSEGRNFQFSQHLVLFDLPLNPDLLEQRIGRLDRIGQKFDIKIHIPYFKNSAQEIMYRWYHQSLNAFAKTNPASHQLFEKFKPLLFDLLHQSNLNITEFEDFLNTTKAYNKNLLEQMQQGRDKLLEYNSCRTYEAEKLLDKAHHLDAQNNLSQYLEQSFDILGVDLQADTQKTYIIRPGEKMQLSLNHLGDEGLTFTYDREVALSNEDIHFFSWTHPLVTEVMDQILSSEIGNTSIITCKIRGIEAGSLLLQSSWVIDSRTALIQSELSITVDIHGRRIKGLNSDFDIDEKVTFSDKDSIENLNKKTASQVLKGYKNEIKSMLTINKQLAEKESEGLIDSLFDKRNKILLNEKQRLKKLQKINPNVRDEEIEIFDAEIKLLEKSKQQVSLQLDAVRLMVCI